MSAPKKSARGTRSEPARRATDSRGVKKRSNATTELFVRGADSTRVVKIV